VDVPVQYFQSTIAIELAVAGALLWQMRYFEQRPAGARDDAQFPHPRLRLLFALVLAATVFGSLWGIANGGGALAATTVTTGVAISLVPILIRVLPPLARDSATRRRDSEYALSLLGLALDAALITAVIALINVD
jgi:hypothetical protein